MTDSSSSFGAELGKKAIRFVVAVLGLLILKAVVGALPMVKHASIIGGTLLSPALVANAIVGTLILIAIAGFGVATGRDLGRRYPRAPDAARAVWLLAVLVVIVLAYRLYQLPLACTLTSPQDLMSLGAGAGADYSQIVGPLSDIVRQIMNGSRALLADEIKNSTGTILLSFQKMALYKMRQSPDVYGLVFLALAAIPVAGLVVIGSRNLDGISEALFRSARAVSAGPRPNPPNVGSGDRRRTGATAGGGHMELSSEDMDKLIRLKTLLDQGAITQADFDAQKRIILREPLPAVEPVELQRLKQLLQAGALTQDEYDVQKQNFLSRM